MALHSQLVEWRRLAPQGPKVNCLPVAGRPLPFSGLPSAPNGVRARNGSGGSPARGRSCV